MGATAAWRKRGVGWWWIRRTFVSSREEDSGYRRVSPRATRRRRADETREGLRKKKRTFRRFRGAHDTKKKGETSERRLRARPRRLGDARYHRASVRQRARGVGRGHDHEQVHDVSLARQVVQQERHRVFGVRRVLDGREKNPRLSRRRRARRGRRRRGKRVGGHSPRFRALAGRVARRLTRGGLGGSGGTGHLARLQSARVRVELTKNGGLESRVYHDRATGNQSAFFRVLFVRVLFPRCFASRRSLPKRARSHTTSHPKPPCLTPPPPSRPPRYVAGAHQKPPDSCAAGALASSRVSRITRSADRSVVPLCFDRIRVGNISRARAFSIERASPTDGRLLHDTHTNRARSSRRSTWTSSPSPAATSWICARPNTTTACISTA